MVNSSYSTDFPTISSCGGSLSVAINVGKVVVLLGKISEVKATLIGKLILSVYFLLPSFWKSLRVLPHLDSNIGKLKFLLLSVYPVNW